MIAWNYDISAAPRDGRELLLAVANTLGTADGGDGVKLHPQWPFSYYIAKWHSDRKVWETTETEWDEHHCLDKYSEPCAWAEINAPTVAGDAEAAFIEARDVIHRSFGVGVDAAEAALRTNAEAKRIYDCAVRALAEVLRGISWPDVKDFHSGGRIDAAQFEQHWRGQQEHFITHAQAEKLSVGGRAGFVSAEVVVNSVDAFGKAADESRAPVKPQKSPLDASERQ